jgi:hypothetical protein
MRNLSYSNVTATIALFAALGGSSYAAVSLPKNSVKSTQVKNGSLLAKDFKAGQLPQGPQGEKGAQGDAGAGGPAGPAGAPATKLFARVNAYSGDLSYASGATKSESLGVGHYAVTFDRDLSDCVAFAQGGFQGNGAGVGSQTHVRVKVDRVEVYTWDAKGSSLSTDFMLAVFC